MLARKCNRFLDKIKKRKILFTRTGIREVFKNAIKFSDLTVGQLAEVMNIQHNRKYRFFATYGPFRGGKLGEAKLNKGERREAVFLYNKNGKYIHKDK